MGYIVINKIDYIFDFRKFIFGGKVVNIIKLLMIFFILRYFIFINLNWEILERVILDIEIYINRI